ncbi:5-phosphohydroxy-L-lysine phospho-lyase-like [Clavelina lepadiformis]|uniref:5-phosphohydroxy-L-lysine phospho-lyase-like n=1 Tax=Clavelina lepadiformis TaxID=159417 RepID=UPI004042FD4D
MKRRHSRSSDGSSGISSGSVSVASSVCDGNQNDTSVSMTSETQLPKEETLRLRNEHLGSLTALYFRENPLKIIRAERQYMYDEEGNQYLDCINNVAHVGHCHPAVSEAAYQQMTQLYTNSRYLHDNLSTYVKRITQLFPDPLTVCFLCNSGSEANDLALRLARAHTGGSEVITLFGAYHGHIQSTIDISPYKWKNGMADKPKYVHVAPNPDMYRGPHANSASPGRDYALEVKKIIDTIKLDGKQLSAFIMESLQSCAGQVLPPPGYMTEAFRYVREAGGVCIADEVQVGFGRVGSHYWGFETQDVIPDIVTIGKPMGNGHPIAGVITTKAIADSLGNIVSSYFNTYGGNPVSCAIGHAVLDVIEDEQLKKNAQEVGEYAVKELQKLELKHKIIGDVRGMGLFVGIEIVKNRSTREPGTAVANEIHRRMKNRRIIISVDGAFDNVLKMKPPMCFSRSNVDHVVWSLDEVMSEIATSDVIKPLKPSTGTSHLEEVNVSHLSAATN